jgi:hypothetical protein
MTSTALELPNPVSALQELRLELRDGRLWARCGAHEGPVKPTRCFPWSEPDHWVSLRDGEGEEVALVEDLGALDESSRAALEAALRETAFVFDVTRIVAVDEEVEIRTWTVHTRQGVRRFQTARDAWPRELPTGDFLVRDVAGDLYRIGDPEQLDAQSRRYLWAFVE